MFLLSVLADQAQRFESAKSKVTFFYYAKMVEHLAETLRNFGYDGDQADQLAHVLYEYNSSEEKK